MPRVATKPMSGSASNAANAAVKKRFPNPVSPGDKDYPAFQRAWMDAYIANGGKYEIQKAETEPEQEKQDEWKGFPYVAPQLAANDALYAPGFSQTPKETVVEECPGSVYPSPYFEDYSQAPFGPFAITSAVKEEKPCCLTGISAKCGHSERSFILEPPTTKTNPAHDQIIQLLAGDNNTDDIIINLQAASSCPLGGVPKIKLDGKNYAKKSLKLSLEAPSANVIGPKMDFIPFVKTFLMVQPGKSSKVYSGGASCVRGGSEFDFSVEVFPQRKWSGTLSMGYELPIDTKTVKYSVLDNEGAVIGQKEAKVYDVDAKGNFAIKGELEGTYAGVETKFTLISYEKEHSVNKSGKVFTKLENFFEKILPKLNVLLSNPLVTITPKWPNVGFGGGCEYFEVSDKYKVARKGNLSLEFKPLFGMSGEADLLNWLIVGGASALGMPHVGLRIAKIKKKAEKGYGNKYVGAKAKASIDLTVSGEISGGLKWEFIPEADDKGTGTVGTSLDIKLKGEVSGEVRVLIVSYKAGAYIQADTGVAGELSCEFYGEEPGFKGKLIFKGIIIEAVIYSGFNGSEDATSNRSGSRGKHDREEKSNVKYEDMGTEESDKIWRIELVPMAEWPSSDKTVVSDGSGV